jgi:predicted RNA-binding protein with PUA-like domain
VSTLTKAGGPNRQYWLVKTEPGSYSFDDLWKAPKRTTQWDGVRNYQARNFLRDEMKRGDLVFFYHSNCETPGIVGIAEVVKEGYPDSTAFDKRDPHFDPKSDPANPTWYMVDLRAVQRFPRVISLAELKGNPELEGMPLLQQGSRLSVQKVGAAEWNVVLGLAKK